MYLLLLLGCPAPEEKPDTAETDAVDTDDTGDEDTDATDTDAPCTDTGIVQFYFLGDFETSDGEYVDASFGYGFYGLRIDDWACQVMGTLPYEGAAPEGCPDCDWSFDLGPITDSVATGDYCDQLGVTDGYLEGYVDYSWGFGGVYYYDYNGTPLELEGTLFLYIDYWFPFAFNYGGRDWTYGDADHVELARPVISGGSYSYYYYYPYPC